MKDTVNHFMRITQLGYNRLVPIVPPGAPLSENSTLFKRIQKLGPEADARGKVPGVRGSNGWYGIDLTKDMDVEISRWHDMGAGVGIKTGRGLVAIDADTLNKDHARIVKQTIERVVGQCPPIRIGQYPKALYLVRTDPDFVYTRIEFGERDDKGRLRDRVEILAENRQFVAHGIHPKTLEPYDWKFGLPRFDDLPFVPTALLHNILDELRPLLPAASELKIEGAGSGADVDQETLRGDPALVEKAVGMIANTSERFPTRESYLDVGYAIKAALPDDPDRAFDLFVDWCERWQDGENDPDVVRADWERMKPPFRRGAGFLYELAEEATGRPGAFTVERFFDAEAAAAKPYEPQFPDASPSIEQPAIQLTPLRHFDPATLPRRQWLYGTQYIRKYVSATAAPSAVGKSSMTMVEALSMASGKPLLGVQPRGTFRVWLWNGEDPIEELELRIAAAMRHYGLTWEDLGDRVFLDSGRVMPVVLATAGPQGAKIATPIVDGVVAAMKANAIDVAIMDPFVSTFSGPETNEMFEPIVKKWGAIAGATNASVELVHHTRKLNGAETAVEDMRGGGALVAGARAKRVLARMTAAEAKKFGVSDEERRRFFRVADASVNMALPAVSSTTWYEMKSVAVGNGDGEGLAADFTGEQVGVATLRTMEEATGDLDGGTVEKIRAALRTGGWREDARSNAWVGYAVADVLGVDAKENRDQIDAVIRDLKARKAIKVDRRPDKNRNKVAFIVPNYPVEAVEAEAAGEENAFD